MKDAKDAILFILGFLVFYAIWQVFWRITFAIARFYHSALAPFFIYGIGLYFAYRMANWFLNRLERRKNSRQGTSSNTMIEDAMTTPAPRKPKCPMDKPDYRGEIGPFCPDCERKHGIKTRLVAREQQGTGKLYFGCPNFDPPYRCRFNGCRDVS